MENIKESSIQSAICDYLTYKKYFFWRNNNIPVFDTKTYSMRAMNKYSIKGVPDIIVIKDGAFIGLEVKTPKGIQSDSQKEFQRRCEENQGYYFIVTSIDDAQKILP